MTNIYKKSLIITLGFTIFSCTKDNTNNLASKKMIQTYTLSESDAEKIYDYAYPMVLMKITQDMIFTAPFRDKTHPNQFLMIKKMPESPDL